MVWPATTQCLHLIHAITTYICHTWILLFWSGVSISNHVSDEDTTAPAAVEIGCFQQVGRRRECLWKMQTFHGPHPSPYRCQSLQWAHFATPQPLSALLPMPWTFWQKWILTGASSWHQEIVLSIQTEMKKAKLHTSRWFLKILLTVIQVAIALCMNPSPSPSSSLKGSFYFGPPHKFFSWRSVLRSVRDSFHRFNAFDCRQDSHV